MCLAILLICRFPTTEGLIKHYREHHNKEINIYSRNFTVFHEFEEWKECHEVETMASFVLNCSPKQRDDYLVYYYYCNRTGQYITKGKGKRSLKLQGSSKLGYHCTAYMKVREHTSGTEVCDFHNHEKQLGHLLLNESSRKIIAAKLSEGVSISSILDYIRDNVEEQMGRRELISRQDIHNIRRQYNIEGIELHANDAQSVSLWVKGINDQCMDSSDNPILLYKPQGVESECELQGALNKEDFCICIQTSFQRDMLIKFGTDTVCMDSTHGTNVYNFNLTTLLVLDEFGEGIPVAWMVCNREDAVALKPFLKKVKEKCGDICTNFFMSDDANNFYNAWREVFTVSNTKKLLCAWHIDKNWRKGLHHYVATSTEQANVYHHLRVLLIETDINTFRQRLQQFISWLSSREDFSDFLQYFQKEYVKRWNSGHLATGKDALSTQTWR